MSQWFECKVKYDRMMENGVQKTVSEPYLVDALSFTEAEARITDKMQPYISGEFKVDAVKRVNLSDIFYDETGDRWYKVKTNFITIDEKTAVEKRTASFQMVQASDIKEALSVYDAGMKDLMANIEVAAITETPLLDVFKEESLDREARQKAQNQD